MHPRLSGVLRLLLALALLLVGGAAGLAGVVLHQYWWGLLLTVAAAPITTYALPPRGATRIPFVVGFVAIVLAGTAARPEGDYLVGTTFNGYALLILAVVLFVGGVVSVVPRRKPPIIAPPTSPEASP